MPTENTERKKNLPPEEDRNSNPDNAMNKKENPEPKEGEYRNIETAVNRPESFDDDKEARMEDELSNDETRSQKESG